MNITAHSQTNIVADPIRAHVEMLHSLASGVDGVLVVSVFNANLPDDKGTVTHHRPGDVDGMVEAIEAHSATPGMNVYIGLQLMRPTLHRKQRGTEADIVAVLGLVADMDADTGRNAGDYPIEPNYVIETSPGNFQPMWLFDRPLPVATAKALAKQLKSATGSDHGTGDITHVWRCPGTLNWPNKKKLDRGRPSDPALVTIAQPWDGSMTDTTEFAVALSAYAGQAREAAPVNLGDLPDVDGIEVSAETAALLAADDVGDRSAHAARVVEKLAFDGHTAEAAAALFMSATGDWFARYEAKDARGDFARLWGKFGIEHEEARAASAETASKLADWLTSKKPKTPPEAANDNEPQAIAPVDPWATIGTPVLPEGLLPPVIEEFAAVQGDVMGVDPGGVACAALAVCAAAIPDKIEIQVKKFDEGWLESARIWVALVGNPSAKKSPVIAAASRPLKSIDGHLYEQYRGEKAKYDALPAEERKTTSPPPNIRMRLEDTTMEAAQEVLKDSTQGVLCLQDELSGWFGSMDKYSGGRGSAKDRSFWLQSFNGGSYVVNRVGRGSVWIDNLSVSMLGGIQPDPMRKIARETVDDGLLQRLFPIVLGPANVGKDVPMPAVARSYSALVERLSKMQKPIRGGFSETHLRLDDGAQIIRTELAEKHDHMIKSWEGINKKLSAHIGKYDGLFARLCVLWHCAETEGDRPSHVVTEDVARRVSEFLHGYLFRHAVAFYSDVLGLSDRHDAVLATAGFILSKGITTITVRDVQRGDSTMRALDRDEAEAVLEKLDAFSWLDPSPASRRDSRCWNVRPEVHRMFESKAKREKDRRIAARELIAGVAA